MAKLPQLKRFLAEDFPEAPPFLSKLFYPLNVFCSTVYSALNNGISFADNILSQVKTISVTGPSGSTSFSYKYSTRPLGIVLLSITDTSATPAIITAATTLAWTYSAGLITVNNITGLTAGKTYLATFLVIGG